MNDVLMGKNSFNSKHQKKSYKAKYSRLNKQKTDNWKFENQPLISLDINSSDEEVVLHDIRHLNYKPKECVESSSIRQIKKPNVKSVNGFTVENTNSDPFHQCEFLDLKVEEGYTLQSISIKYQCAISDIKRANNLISDQDFYARTHLKIPVKKYSLLTEILPPSVHIKNDSIQFEEFDKDIRTINIGIGGSMGRSPSPQEAAAFFKRMDEDLVKIMLSTNSQKDSLEAATAVLTTPQIQPLVKDPYNTVDCGIQWNYLVIFIVIVAVVIPGFIALYMYMRPSHDYPDSSVSKAKS